MPMPYQLSPFDDSRNTSLLYASSNHGHHPRSPIDQNSHTSAQKGHPISIDQISPYSEARIYTGRSQEYATFQDQAYGIGLQQGVSVQSHSRHVDDTVSSTHAPVGASDHQDYVHDGPSHAETEAYLRRTLSIPAPMPLNLWSLPNEPFPGKPPKISELIKLAIWGSPCRSLTLREIFAAIEERYPSYKQAADKPWQRSIRHNLSLRAMFINIARPSNHPGKGCYWTLDVRMGEGNKRDRKRRDPRGDRPWRDDDEYSETSDTPSEKYGVVRDLQRQPGYVSPGVYAAAPPNTMQYSPSFMAQADTTMFAPSAPGAYAFGMETTSSSPAYDSAYALSPTTFSDQSPWASLGTNGVQGMVPYTGSNESAHRCNVGGVPMRQHAHEPYHSTPVGWEGGAGAAVADAWRHGAGRY